LETLVTHHALALALAYAPLVRLILSAAVGQ